jgi:hypothetical protein
VVDESIEDLVENGDIIENTLREYIVGYIVKKLAEADEIGES